jgi:hypothetical protein
MQLRKNVVNYLKCTATDEGYLVAEMMRMGKVQLIALPLPINPTVADAKDQKIICKYVVRAITKQKAKLDSMLEKGYTTV